MGTLSIYDQTGSGKSNMAGQAPKRKYQLADQLGTQFQRQNLCFRGSPIQWNQPRHKIPWVNGGLVGIANSNMASYSNYT